MRCKGTWSGNLGNGDAIDVAARAVRRAPIGER